MMRSFIALLLAAALPSAAAVATPEPEREASEKASDPAAKVICKRFLETGSLVRGYRLCKTKADWERARDNVRQGAPSSSCRLAGAGGAC